MTVLYVPYSLYISPETVYGKGGTELLLRHQNPSDASGCSVQERERARERAREREIERERDRERAR